MICILKFTKGHNSVKLTVKLWYLFCAHGLIMLYICTKFCQSISEGFRVTDPGPVVQSMVSLMSSLRGQLIKCFMTL